MGVHPISPLSCCRNPKTSPISCCENQCKNFWAPSNYPCYIAPFVSQDSLSLSLSTGDPGARGVVPASSLPLAWPSTFIFNTTPFLPLMAMPVHLFGTEIFPDFWSDRSSRNQPVAEEEGMDWYPLSPHKQIYNRHGNGSWKCHKAVFLQESYDIWRLECYVSMILQRFLNIFRHS